MTLALAFKMAIRPFGDSALLIDIDAGSTDASSDIVMALNAQLSRQHIRGITQTTPSYNSLLVCFEPEQVQHSSLQREIHAIADTIDIKDIPKGNQWSLPACFDAPYALDHVALETELSQDWQSIVDCFCATEYRVHAVGFLPGFTYLGNLPEALHCDRLPASSIAIAGGQAGIYPFDSPGGWRIIGRLPFTVFQTRADPPALFKANDRIRFEAVTPEVFEALEQRPIASAVKQATRR
jgi:inhibitor of KinA